MDHDLRAPRPYVRHHRGLATRHHTLYHSARSLGARLASNRTRAGGRLRSAAPGWVVNLRAWRQDRSVKVRTRRGEQYNIDIFSALFRFKPRGTARVPLLKNPIP